MARKLHPKNNPFKVGKARRTEKTVAARDGSVRTMTLAAIYRKYPNQWVLISEPCLTKDLEVIEGIVVAHSKDIDAIYKIIRTGKYSRAAIEFTGHIPKNVGIAF